MVFRTDDDVTLLKLLQASVKMRGPNYTCTDGLTDGILRESDSRRRVIDWTAVRVTSVDAT